MRTNKIKPILALALVPLLATACAKKSKDTPTPEPAPTVAQTGGGLPPAAPVPYKPQTAPAKMAVTTPKSMQKTAIAALRLTDATATSVAYAHLSDAVERESSEIHKATTKLYEIDVAMPQIDAYCTQKVSAAWTSCEIGADAVKLTYTDAMYKGITEVLGGEENIEADTLKTLKEGLGTEYALDTMTFKRLDAAASPEGYLFEASFTENADDTYKMTWNGASVSTAIHYKEALADGRLDEGDYVIAYDDAKKSSRIESTYVLGDERGHERLSFGEDAKSEKHGMWFKVDETYQSRDGSYSLAIDGYADDEGGLGKAKEVNDTVSVSAATLSATVALGQAYLITGADVIDAAKVDWDVAVGTFTGDGTANVQASFDYWDDVRGIATVAPKLNLWAVTLDADGNIVKDPAPVLATQKFATIAVKVTPEDNYFTEFFKVGGALSYYCQQAEANGACVVEQGSKADLEATVYDENEAQAPEEGIKIVVAGFTAADVDGGDLYIVPADVDLTTVNPGDASVNDLLVGYGSFEATGDSDAALPADLANYKFDFWGAADPAASKVYYVKYLDGDAKFVLATAATIVKAP